MEKHSSKLAWIQARPEVGAQQESGKRISETARFEMACFGFMSGTEQV